MSERIYYAVGDVHGEHERLVALHDAIEAHWRLYGGGRPATIVHVGDYVDRGPDSRRVVQFLIDRQRAAEERADRDVLCLLGNHERMMIDALETGEQPRLIQWLLNGGEATFESYRRVAQPETPMAEIFPREHLDWMKALPSQVLDREAGLLFVHAGVQPDKFPECPEEVRLWTRAKKFMKDAKWPKNAELDGLTVVHGHTPTDDGAPYVGPRRINLDTGAVYGGPLTAAVLKDGAPPEFLYVRRETAEGRGAR